MKKLVLVLLPLIYLDLPDAKHREAVSIWRPLFFLFSLIIILSVLIVFAPIDVFDIPASDIKGFVKQELFVAMLVILSNLLVAYNTYLFMDDVDRVLMRSVPQTSDHADFDIRRHDRISKGCNLTTFFLSGGVIMLYGLKVFDRLNFDLESLFFINEMATLVIFLLFCIGDYFLLRLLNIAKDSNTSDQKLQALDRFTKRAFPLIDIAGFIGVCIIGGLSLFLRIYINEHFVEGFAIGALAFHIIFTQINFAYLKTVELKEN